MSGFPIGISAQISVDANKNALDLVLNITNNSPCIIVSNETAKWHPTISIDNSYGIFNKNSSDFPFDSGIVLSTWSSKNSEGPYVPNKTRIGPINWAGDTDINSILGINSAIANNATSLEFDFIAQTNFLSFEYIFASNEYIKDRPCKFSDGLALLIKDVTAGGNYKNLAVLPDGTPVSSKNIHPAINYTDTYTNTKCDAKNESYFGKLNTLNPSSSPINYAGQTIPLIAKTNLIKGNTYHIKFVITNDIDNDNNSALFIKKGSFTSAIDLGKDRLISDKTAICSGETFEINTNLSIAGFNFKWYKDTNTAPIPGEMHPSLQITQAGTYKVEAIGTSCALTGKIKVEYGAGMNLNDVELIRCDNGSGSALFDLTSANSIITNNNPDTTIPKFYADSNQTIEIPYPKAFEKTNSGDQVVYAKGINSKLNCSETAKIKLITKSSSPNLSNIPKPILNDFAGGNNSIELISPSTTSTFEFSIDGINYQEQPLFLRIPKGVYIAYIRNKTSCEYFTYPFTILDYPNFFTPNSYSTNNEWKIKDLDEYTSAVVYIFDRYGKLLKQMDAISESWDGISNGFPLPADDYWFRLILNDNQIINGHFSLIR